METLKMIIEWVQEKLQGVEQNNPHHLYDAAEHTMKVMRDLIGAGAPEEVVLAGLLHDVGKARTRTVDPVTGHDRFFKHAAVGVEMIKESGLPVSEEVLLLVERHEDFINLSEKRLKYIDEATRRKLVMLRRADIRAQNPEFAEAKLQDLQDWESQNIGRNSLCGECVSTHCPECSLYRKVWG